jgi:hypothetical protein
MPSKKELYASAKKLKSKTCPSISGMSKKQLETYIAGRNAPIDNLKPINVQKPIKAQKVIKPAKSRGALKMADFDDVMPPKKKAKTIKIRIKKDKMMKKLEPIPEQKPIAPVKKIKMKQSLQTAVLAKFNKMKSMKKKKVEEKFDIEEFKETGSDGLTYNKKSGIAMWKGNAYKPFSIEQFMRLVDSYNSHKDGIDNPKLFGMGKKLVKQSMRSMVSIQANMDTERV